MPTVGSTVTDAAGDPVEDAQVVIRLIAASPETVPAAGFVGADDETVVSQISLTTDENGEWSTNLVANSLITPAGTYYLVTERPDVTPRRPAVKYRISVPDTVGPHWAGDLLVEAPDDLPSAVSVASAVSFNPVGSLAATNVQAAIAELDAEVDTRIDTLESGTSQVLAQPSFNRVLGTQRKEGAGAFPTPTAPTLVISADGTKMDPDGPKFFSCFHAASVLGTPLDEWYGYVAGHDSDEIWLVTAPALEGPWTYVQAVMSPALSPLIQTTVSSPAVLFRDGQVLLYYHGQTGVGSEQATAVAVSADGVTFTEQANFVVATSESTNPYDFDARAATYMRFVDIGPLVVGVYQANNAKTVSGYATNVVNVGCAVSEDGITFRPFRKPLIASDPDGYFRIYGPTLLRINGQFVVLANRVPGTDWEGVKIDAWVSDELKPGTFQHIGDIGLDIPAGKARISAAEAIWWDGKLHLFYMADDDATFLNGQVYHSTIDWRVA